MHFKFDVCVFLEVASIAASGTPPSSCQQCPCTVMRQGQQSSGLYVPIQVLCMHSITGHWKYTIKIL